MCDDKTHGSRHFAGGHCFSPRDIARMKHMAGHFMKNFMGHFGTYIPHNVEDLGEMYLITVPLSGRTKDDVTVSIINNILNVTASKPSVPEREDVKRKQTERAFPSTGFRFIDINMDIPLPADANENSISSKMANGLLRITVNKKPAKNIDISDERNN